MQDKKVKKALEIVDLEGFEKKKPQKRRFKPLKLFF